MAGIRKSPAPVVPGFFFYTSLYKSRFFQRCVRPVFCNGAQSFGGHFDCDVGINLRHVDTLLLEIWLSLRFSAGIKLRRTGAVTVATSDLGFLPGNFTLLCHTALDLVRVSYHTQTNAQ